MGPTLRALLVAAAAALLPDAASAGTGPASAPETVTVIVKKTAVRRDRQFYDPAVAEASYGDKHAVAGKEKDWVRVTAGGASGWVHASAVTAKAVKGSAGGAGAPVSSDEVALAGKGFNRQVESAYREKNPEANFAAVDRMEKLTAGEAQLAGFARDGKLQPRGGAP